MFSTRVYIIERGIDDDVMTKSVTARPTLWHSPPPPIQNTRHPASGDLMLGQRLRRWTSIKPPQARRPTFFWDLRPALT